MAINVYDPNLVKSAFESPDMGLPKLGLDSEREAFPTPPTAPNQGPAESKFEQALKDTVGRVNETQNAADQSVARLAAGQEPNIHHTMIQLEQAEISLRLAMQVRSKVLEAYQEVMRMQM